MLNREKGQRIDKIKRTSNPSPNLGEAKTNQGVSGVGSAVRRGIFKGTAKGRWKWQRQREGFSYVTGSDEYDA